MVSTVYCPEAGKSYAGWKISRVGRGEREAGGVRGWSLTQRQQRNTKHTKEGVTKYSRHLYLHSRQTKLVATLVWYDYGAWFLAEAKTSETMLSPTLASMQKATGAAHAFQIVRDLPYANVDAFSFKAPIAVSARGFLSQLF